MDIDELETAQCDMPKDDDTGLPSELLPEKRANIEARYDDVLQSLRDFKHEICNRIIGLEELVRGLHRRDTRGTEIVCQ